MNIQNAVNNGYYFDRCVDLYFYDSQKNLLGSLVCPKRSFKPSITVKGEYIEGEYAISSYISIQNMSYDVDVNAVAYIDCQMYYGALTDSKKFDAATANTKSGHSVLFSVLYCDQEKEPPNRAVRFQCTVAAQDRTRFDYRIAVTTEGKVLSGLEFEELPESKKEQGTGSKPKEVKAKLIDILKKIADVHNETVARSAKVTSDNSIYVAKLNEKLYISSIVCDNNCADWPIVLDPGQYTIGSLLRKLNNYATDVAGNESYCRWKICMNSGTLNVTTIVPKNWRLVAEAEGNKTESEQTKYFNKYYKYNTYYIYTGDNWDKDVKWSDGSAVVYLNYVKSAYRNETVIHCSTIYDDRIRPGCHCVIQGNAIMGRHTGRGGKSGSRMISLTNQLVLFRVTGGVEFEFSTTEDSEMTLVGAIENEDWKPPQEGDAGSINR